MLEKVLQQKADELSPLIYDQGWQDQEITHRIQAIVRTESGSMLMDGVIAAMAEIETMFERQQFDGLKPQTEQVVQRVIELRRYFAAEVGGAFSLEVASLCNNIEQQMVKVVTQHREISLRMAMSMAWQIISVWRMGIESYLIERNRTGATGLPRWYGGGAELFLDGREELPRQLH